MINHNENKYSKETPFNIAYRMNEIVYVITNIKRKNQEDVHIALTYAKRSIKSIEGSLQSCRNIKAIDGEAYSNLIKSYMSQFNENDLDVSELIIVNILEACNDFLKKYSHSLKDEALMELQLDIAKSLYKAKHRKIYKNTLWSLGPFVITAFLIYYFLRRNLYINIHAKPSLTTTDIALFILCIIALISWCFRARIMSRIRYFLKRKHH